MLSRKCGAPPRFYKNTVICQMTDPLNIEGLRDIGQKKSKQSSFIIAVP